MFDVVFNLVWVVWLGKYVYSYEVGCLVDVMFVSV